MMNLKLPVLITSLLVLSGCLPTIKKQWDVQPVEGIVKDGDTQQPVAGATITNRENPELTATSDAQGRFVIEEQTHVGFHLLMAASALDRQVWLVTHPDYADAIAETTSFIPPLSRTLSQPEVPLYPRDSLDAAPENCAFFGYLKRQGQQLAKTHTRPPAFLIEECADAAARDQLYELWYR